MLGGACAGNTLLVASSSRGFGSLGRGAQGSFVDSAERFLLCNRTK